MSGDEFDPVKASREARRPYGRGSATRILAEPDDQADETGEGESDAAD